MEIDSCMHYTLPFHVTYKKWFNIQILFTMIGLQSIINIGIACTEYVDLKYERIPKRSMLEE